MVWTLEHIQKIEDALGERRSADAIALVFEYYQWRLAVGGSTNCHRHCEGGTIVGDDTYVKHLETILLRQLR